MLTNPNLRIAFVSSSTIIRLIRHHLQPLIESLAWTTKVLFSDPDNRRSLHPNAVLHQQHNKRWWIQRFIRYSEKCTGCCSPTFGSTSIIGDQQAGRGGVGGAMSQGEGIIWRMIHAVLAPSGDTGDCSNKIILINSGARLGGRVCNRSKHGSGSGY